MEMEGKVITEKYFLSVGLLLGCISHTSPVDSQKETGKLWYKGIALQ